MEVAFGGGQPYETLVQLPNLRFGAPATKDMQDPGLLRFRIEEASSMNIPLEKLQALRNWKVLVALHYAPQQ